MVKKDIKYLVTDIETTGLSHTKDGITEIVAFAYDENWNLITKAVDTLLNPQKEIPTIVSDLTNITDEMVEGKLNYKYGVREFWDFVKKHNPYIIAHNAVFEYNFLTSYYQGWIKQYNKYIDTRSLYLYLKDGDTSQNTFTRNYSKLKNVANYFNLPYNEDRAHRAQYDVELTAKVAKFMLQDINVLEASVISWKYIKGKHTYGQATFKKKQLQWDLPLVDVVDSKLQKKEEVNNDEELLI